MAEGLNRVMLLGNLGADPELRYTKGGQAVLKLRLATTERYKDQSGEWKDRTEWHSVTVWGKRGEALSKFLNKGSNIFVEGSLRTTSWEKDGQKHYRTEVNANQVLLTGGRGGGGGAPRTQPQAQGGGGGDYYEQTPPPSEAFEGGFGPSGGDDDDIPF
jgi:single-strand DNA-binding protein